MNQIPEPAIVFGVILLLVITLLIVIEELKKFGNPKKQLFGNSTFYSCSHPRQVPDGAYETLQVFQGMVTLTPVSITGEPVSTTFCIHESYIQKHLNQKSIPTILVKEEGVFSF